MINYTEAEVTGRLVNVLCQVGFTTLSAKFLVLDIPIDRDAPIVVGHGFLDTIGGNIDIPRRTLTTFDGLTRQTFRAARSDKIKIAESDSDDEEEYWKAEIHLTDPYGNVYSQAFVTKPTKRKLSKYHKLSDIMSPN
ncbi:hypothetical protein Tco_0159824, partial [Tanacetum coccineum]